MSYTTSIFDAHELFNLVNAQYSATRLEEETGVSSDWSEFAGHLESKFNTLNENDQEELEKLLKNVAQQEAEQINMLQELNANDFDEIDDFWNERKELQRDITNDALDSLEKYWDEE